MSICLASHQVTLLLGVPVDFMRIGVSDCHHCQTISETSKLVKRERGLFDQVLNHFRLFVFDSQTSIAEERASRVRANGLLTGVPTSEPVGSSAENQPENRTADISN